MLGGRIMADTESDRCRLVLVTPADMDADAIGAALEDARRGGDIASVIVPQRSLDEDAFQAMLETIVPIGQAAGAAVIAAGPERMAVRAGADGIHLEAGAPKAVATAVATHAGRLIVGASAGTSRHAALDVGEARPDYVFFGRLGGDTHPEAHPKSARLADWWATLVEIPAILMGGNDLAHLDAAAATGVEFVALSRAVFGAGVDPAEAVHAANAVLSQHVLQVAA